jgi:hypothetical protein
MNMTELASNVLAGWIAIFHFAVVYLWPTVRALTLVVSPFIAVAIVLGWRPRMRAEKPVLTTHD